MNRPADTRSSDSRSARAIMESTATHREEMPVVPAKVWRWKPTNGTGVLLTEDGTYVWFHVSDLDGLKHRDVHEGLPVDVVMQP